jgi:hypothetical protein
MPGQGNGIVANFNRPQAEVIIDEQDRKDYVTPSRSLFSEHCECVVNCYGLREGLIRKEKVQDIKYNYVDDSSETDERIFTMYTEKTYNARTIVLAVGPGNPPATLGMEYTQRVQGACHSLRIQRFPDPSVQKKVDEKRPTKRNGYWQRTDISSNRWPSNSPWRYEV